MSLPPNLQELLGRARQVIVAESAAVLSAAESLDQNFAAVAQVLLACSGKLSPGAPRTSFRSVEPLHFIYRRTMGSTAASASYKKMTS